LASDEVTVRLLQGPDNGDQLSTNSG